MLKIYAATNSHNEYAILVFANNIKEAKKLAFPSLNSFGIDEYIDMRVFLLKDKKFLYKQADKKLLDENIAHVIEDPDGCLECFRWDVSELNENSICSICSDKTNQLYEF